MSSFGGGLVNGDRVAMQVTVGRGAAAFVSTQASSKIYRSPAGTSARLDAVVEDEGLLVLAPDPVVPFAGATFTQDQHITLLSRSSIVLVDWVSSGRRESGESWAFDAYTSRQRLVIDDALVLQDAVTLRRADGDLMTRLGRFAVLATVVLAGTPLLAQARTLVAESSRAGVEKRPAHLAVAAMLEHRRLGEAGCLMRVAGQSVDEVGRIIRSSLRFVPDLLGDDPWARKW